MAGFRSSMISAGGKLAKEFGRRTSLARQPRPDGVSGPSARLLLGELGDLKRPVPADIGYRARRPQPVMVIPGFGSHPKRMKPLLSGLEQAGHTVEGWGLGFNLGPTPDNFEYLMRRVRNFARQHGQPVALVGWSLGGLFAREIARRQPEAVSLVITMGTPFSGDMHANNGWRAYQAITGHPVDDPPIDCDISLKPPVRTVALWSPRDGIVAPRSAAGWPGERDAAVALRCTHMGFAYKPEVIEEVLRQLDAEDERGPPRCD